jgi:hypothetical protein
MMQVARKYAACAVPQPCASSEATASWAGGDPVGSGVGAILRGKPAGITGTDFRNRARLGAKPVEKVASLSALFFSETFGRALPSAAVVIN